MTDSNTPTFSIDEQEINQNSAAILDLILSDRLLSYFKSNSRFRIYGGILRHVIEFCDRPLDQQKKKLAEYFKNGGDIDILVDERIEQLFDAKAPKLFEAIDGAGDPRTKRVMREQDQNIKTFNQNHKMAITKITHNNSIYLTRELQKTRFCNKHCKIYTDIQIDGETIDLTIDVTVCWRDEDLLYDFDVNALIYDTNKKQIVARNGVVTKVLLDENPPAPTTGYCYRQKPKKSYVSVTIPNLNLCQISEQIKRKRFRVVGGLDLVKGYRFRKMYNRGFKIVDEQYDILAAKLEDFCDLDGTEGVMIEHLLSQPERLHKFLASIRDSLLDTESYKWTNWIPAFVGSVRFHLAQPYLKHFEGIAIKSYLVGSIIKGHIRSNTLEDFKRYDAVLEFKYDNSVDDPILETGSIPALNLLKEKVPVNPERLDRFAGQPFEIFMWAYNSLSDFQRSTSVNWPRVMQSALHSNDYRNVEFIVKHHETPLEFKPGDYMYATTFSSTFNYEFVEGLFRIVKREDLHMLIHALLRVYKFVPPILFLMVRYKLLTQIMIEWFLDSHIKVIQKHYSDYKLYTERQAKDEIICVFIDILIREGYKKEVQLYFDHNSPHLQTVIYANHAKGTAYKAPDYLLLIQEWDQKKIDIE